MADSEENGSDARKHERVFYKLQNRAPSIYFDLRGPRKSYSNIMDRDPSSGKNIGAMLFMCCAICPGAYSGEAQKKASMLAHCDSCLDSCLVEECLTGFVGAPHKASFFFLFFFVSLCFLFRFLFPLALPFRFFFSISGPEVFTRV